MSSGFYGGGEPEFYSDSSGGARPRSSPLTSDPPPMYLRPPQQFRGNFIDNNSNQIARQSPYPPMPLGLIGKRTLSEFQNHATLNNLLRSVRPSQASVLPHSASLEYTGPISLQRYGTHLLQQQKSQTINPTANQNMFENMSIPNLETERQMRNRLHELEKQLLDDNDENAADGASVVTNTNSEWSETIQSLINPTPKPISSSPSSSSSSSPSSSISVASPVSVSMKQSLIEAATAIYDGRSDLSGEILVRLSASSNPKGNTEQRLMNYVLSALKSRVNAVENPPPVAELSSREHVQSTQLLYKMSPCFKLGFLAANSAILEVALEPPVASQLHIIDFDIGEGGQYHNILHALSTRQAEKPSVLKITAVTDDGGVTDAERLRSVREDLIQAASKAGIGIRFHVVVSQNLNELSRDSLGCDADEALVVNFAFKLSRMPDESVSVENPRDALLRRVKHLSPRVVTLVEQEWNANTAPFLMRVNEAFGYYGALLDSIESTVVKDSPERVLIEEELSRKVVNSIACEGQDRVERCEVFGKWRARMGMAGFELRPMSASVVETMKTRLTSGNRVNPGFTVKEEGGGGVGFGWLGRTLTVASAWR